VGEALRRSDHPDHADEQRDRREILAALAQKVRPVVLAGEQRLPVLEALEGLVPQGLRRGWTVGVGGPASTSLLLALAAGPSQAGSWVAGVGLESLGLVAAAELGVALERLVLVAEPPPAQWGEAVAALVDAFDVVLVRSTRPVRAADERRLAARVRERGTVLLRLDGESGPWTSGADVDLEVVAAEWDGLAAGHGYLRSRHVVVRTGGRRGAARPREVALWLPAADGRVAPVVDAPVALRPEREARAG
jgi:hypothetical protein